MCSRKSNEIKALFQLKGLENKDLMMKSLHCSLLYMIWKSKWVEPKGSMDISESKSFPKKPPLQMGLTQDASKGQHILLYLWWLSPTAMPAFWSLEQTF